MQASETKLKDIIEGVKQYLIPLFQRPYSWQKMQWQQLWDDLDELFLTETGAGHFFGSIVTMQVESAPEGVSQYLLIDGQQRLTTIFILLSAIRDCAKYQDDEKFSASINNKYLVNSYEERSSYYKLLPTQIDQDYFYNIIDNNLASIPTDKNYLYQCYLFFSKKLKKFDCQQLRALSNLIASSLIIISIVLSKDDNPYLVFESLNAKGQPLTQADLIRNYLFMGIKGKEQVKIYEQYWLPMQNLLGDNLTEFFRYFLTKKGTDVLQNQVYLQLKQETNQADIIAYLKNLYKFAQYYSKFLEPAKETNQNIAKYLIRLQKLDSKTIYPFLLNCYDNLQNQELSEKDFIRVCQIIENFILRRFVCNVQTRGLNRIFAVLYSQVTKENKLNNGSFLENLTRQLQTQNYPLDEEFRAKLQQVKLYGSNRTEKAQLILQSLEENRGHKEKVSFDNLTIEHIMPQKLSSWWQNHLGEEYEITHELLLHSLGNLTLTAYNSELSNDTFFNKQKELNHSHLEINKYFHRLRKWQRDDIEKRGEILADECLEIWAYFGDKNYKGKTRNGVTGTIPKLLVMFNQEYNLKSWRDVVEITLNNIIDTEPDQFEELLLTFPRFLATNKGELKSTRQLKNGVFVEVGLSAQDIYSFCQKILENCDLSQEDWDLHIEEKN